MKKITIGKKEYTFEFTIEASLYDDCTKSVMDTFVKGGMAQGALEMKDAQGAVDALIDTIANLPQKALTLFYAGLLEHHGPEGDGSIAGKPEAKRVLATYLKENNKTFRDVFEEMMEAMANDNFFDLIGLNQLTETMTEVTKEKVDESLQVGKNTSTKK